MSTGFATTGYYLLDNPPRRSQGRRQRRSKPTGCIVLHTAESATDIQDADGGAEGVAAFIRRRVLPGNYHTIGDRDSIIRMYPFSWEVWQDGTGSNAWAIGISLAMRSADWSKLSNSHRDAYLNTMVTMAAEAARWLQSQHGIDVPPRRLSKPMSDIGLAGFIAHGDRDPARRSDPGREFPWGLFLERFATEMDGNETMKPYQVETVTAIQRRLDAEGYDLGPFGVDGDPGPATLRAFSQAMHDLDRWQDAAQDAYDVLKPVAGAADA